MVARFNLIALCAWLAYVLLLPVQAFASVEMGSLARSQAGPPAGAGLRTGKTAPMAMAMTPMAMPMPVGALSATACTQLQCHAQPSTVAPELRFAVPSQPLWGVPAWTAPDWANRPHRLATCAPAALRPKPIASPRPVRLLI